MKQEVPRGLLRAGVPSGLRLAEAAAEQVFLELQSAALKELLLQTVPSKW